jgi:hypothetical protein
MTEDTAWLDAIGAERGPFCYRILKEIFRFNPF